MREVPDFDDWGPGGGPSKYDWDTMFNGKKWALHKSQVTTLHAFQRLAYKRASQRLIHIRTKIEGDEIVVQAISRSPRVSMREVVE